jgi:hypothetical protein
LVYKKSIELPKVFLHLIEEGLIVLKFKDDVVIEVEDAKEIDQIIYDQLALKKPFVILVDALDVASSITHEARDFFSKDKLIMETRKAQALIVNNLQTKLLANFYMKFHKPKNPIKVFKNYDLAYQWIKSIRDNYYK